MRNGKFTAEDCIYGITEAKKELLVDYHTLEVELGVLQRHTRGEVDLPIGGAPDVLGAIIFQKRRKR